MFQSHKFYTGLIAGLTVPLVALTLSPSQAALSPSSSEATPGLTVPLLAQEPIVETVLFFETDSAAVRIYRRGSDLFMNLYNKATGVVEVNDTPAELVPSTRDQTVYKNSMGEAERFARITVQGETELEIIGGNGEVVLQEPGFNAVIGVPGGETDFQGNNFAPGTGAIVISAQYANLRSEPRLGSEIVGSADRREIVDVVDRVGNIQDGYIWYKVLYDGMTGWIRGDLLVPA
jgi:uncharacterized protein YgiM (DUF1202 family)